MSMANVLFQIAQNMKQTVKTASATLVESEFKGGIVIGNHASVTVALTLPTITSELKNRWCLFANKGAATTTVAITAGYGGAGSGTDTITLAQGDMALIFCDGTYYYSLHHTTGG